MEEIKISSQKRVPDNENTQIIQNIIDLNPIIEMLLTNVPQNAPEQVEEDPKIPQLQNTINDLQGEVNPLTSNFGQYS